MISLEQELASGSHLTPLVPAGSADRTRLWTFLGLLRLLRLARAPRLMSRMEQLYSIDHGMLSIMTFVMQTCLLAHFCACLWGVAPIMQGSIWGPDPDQEHDISHFVGALLPPQRF